MSQSKTYSVGETLVQYLDQQGVDVVFGIPGVHTIELYRGLAASGIRHVTPRHEQGAGFMADGYARVSGKPGVAFVITGPGVTNILTPMAQSLADNIAVLVVSSVNEDVYLGKGLGHLHELPDQHGLCSLVALRSEHVSTDSELLPALEGIFSEFANATPGPRHIQIPLDVMGQRFAAEVLIDDADAQAKAAVGTVPSSMKATIQKAQALLSTAQRPLIIVGGGSLGAEQAILQLAETLEAPVVQTINARGLMHGHALKVPASPSLNVVREGIEAADVVLAIGTQIAPTDYDMYHLGELPQFQTLIRVDISPEQLVRHPAAITLCGDARNITQALSNALAVQGRHRADWGRTKATELNAAALAELSPDYVHMVRMMETIRDTLPGSVVVGDSTQPIYAVNMYYGHDNPKGWFNASVGYGALGYGIPAAIGAQLAAPDKTVVCVTGDGGAQFTLPELMVAADEKLPVIFIIWNNRGYQEIETSMAAANVAVVGCDPAPPDFKAVAAANRMPYLACENKVDGLAAVLRAHRREDGPVLIEIGA